MDAEEDPEEHIRDLERGVSMPTGATPHSSGTGSGAFWPRFRGLAELANTNPGRLLLASAVAAAIAAVTA